MKYLHTVWQYITAHDFETNDKVLNAFGAFCYDLCIQWFGPPRDAYRCYRIIYGPRDRCFRNLFDGNYYLSIRSEYQSMEQRYAALAHEMYHRVTRAHRGLHRFIGIDEMMAFLTSQRILRHQGFHSYADLRINRYNGRPVVVDATVMYMTRRCRFLSGFCMPSYPSDFAAMIAVIGTQLEERVGWQQMCRLIHCRTWDEWLAPLPADLRSEICDLLALPSVTRR